MHYIYYMHKRLFLTMIIFLSAWVKAQAQITTYQLSLNDSTKNVLYTNIPNQVVIKNLPAGARVVFREWNVTPINGSYFLNMAKQGTDSLLVYDKNETLIFSKTYNVVKYDQQLQMGNAKYMLTSLDDILANPCLNFYSNEATLLKPLWRITHYTISTLINGVYETDSAWGENLTDKPFDKHILDKIAGMKEHDRIFIEDIDIYGPDGFRWRHGSLNYTIAFTPNAEEQDNGYANIRKELRIVVNEIATRKVVSNNNDGLLEKLEEVATDSELGMLTDDKNTIVKNYAFLALIYKKSTASFSVVMKHLHDTSTVEHISGDVGMPWKTNDIFLLSVLPSRGNLNTYKLTPSQTFTIDSILLTDPSYRTNYSDFALRSMPAAPSFYQKIRTIALAGKEQVAFVILARYQNKNDIDIIANALKAHESYSIEAVREFPDPSFYPYVVKRFDQELAEWKPHTYFSKWNVILQALARYPKPETYDIFKRITELQGEENNEIRKSLLIAITKFPNPLYEPLKLKIGLSSIFDFDIKDEIKREQW